MTHRLAKKIGCIDEFPLQVVHERKLLEESKACFQMACCEVAHIDCDSDACEALTRT